MVTFWKKISIRYKIIIIGIVIIMFFAATVFFYYIPALENSILSKKKEKIKEHTEIAIWTINNFYRDFKEGTMKEDMAKKLAISHVKRIRYGPEKKDYLWINDFKPKMIMHPYATHLDGKDLSDFKDKKNKKLFVEFVKVCKKNGSGFVDYYWQWKDNKNKIVPKISYVQAFKPWQWIIGTGIYIEDVKEEITALYTRTTLITGLIVIISITIILIISNAISNPIKGLINGLKDSDLNTELTCDTNDEIGEMTIHFNDFIKKIKTLVLDIHGATSQLASSSEEMSAAAVSFSDYAMVQNHSVTDVTQTVHEITSEMDGVTIDIDKQFEILNTLVQRTEELSDLINSLALDIQKTMKIMNSIAKEAKSGEESLNQMYQSMSKIGKSSNVMNNIVEMINDISDQINLLSLNASIEAARAGESGRGFAVVADEISKLADETATSIKSIQTIITENDVEITQGVSSVDNTVQAMKKILNGVGISSSMINNISLKMRDQVGTKETVNREVQQVKEMSEIIRITTKVQKQAVSEISDLVFKINKGAESISSGSEEMASSSEEVASMAEFLKQKVEYFKV